MTLQDNLISEQPDTDAETSPEKRKRGRPRKVEAQRDVAAAEPVKLTGRAKKAVSATTASMDGVDVPLVAPKTVDPRNALNDLTSTEWLPETVSVWNQKGLGANHPDAQIERQHPAPFSFTDVSRIVKFFTKRGGVVLDPFVGVGSTLKACAVEGRNGIGFELNPRYAELAQERLRTEVRDLFAANVKQDIQIGDARDLIRGIPENSLDLVVTSPPYWNILHKEDHKAKQERKEHDLDTRYSDDARDLGNIHNYEDFLSELCAILGACGKALKPKKHMAVIVSDFRDKSKFVMFHADLAKSMEKYGMELRGLTVLYQRHKRVFPYGYPYAYVPNIHHQYIVILQKSQKI
jgi:DNA modification methylase